VEKVRGVELNVRDAGDGRPVAFLHGVTCSGWFFKHQLDRAGTGAWRAIVPDFRGHGDSEKVLEGHTVPNYAQDLHALLESLGVERPVLVGWSMGAMVAFEYLKAFGQDSVAGLVVVDQPPSDFAWPGYEFAMFTPEVLGHTVDALQMTQPAVAEEFAGLMLHAPTPEVVEEFVRELCKPPAAVATSILVDQTFRDYREFLPEISVPTLVAFGGDDKATNPAAGKWMADRIPGARLEVFEASSHCPFFEEPEAFNRALEGFLAGL
jgi:pimeloyl-ACP methyl ester carboxylesterase